MPFPVLFTSFLFVTLFIYIVTVYTNSSCQVALELNVCIRVEGAYNMKGFFICMYIKYIYTHNAPKLLH